jgi:pimeloyl-ACP methyl ester carboxylesterase
MVLGFHGDHGSHASPFGGITPDRLLAAEPAGFRVAIAAADGGNGYWHAHGDDDPMAMLIDEFLPMCRDRGLATDLIGVMGTSMGGYGALLFAESQRRRVAAVAAISPAVFSSYDDARAANPEAFSSEHDFAVHDVIAHASRLSGLPVRVAVGDDDPLRPADEQLSRVLPAGSVFEESKGCHTGDFFDSQALPSLSFVAARLASA